MANRLAVARGIRIMANILLREGVEWRSKRAKLRHNANLSHYV